VDFGTNKGIYKITCTPTGKFYIGSSVDLKRRRYWHLHQLANNDHNNKHLQSAYNKYGSEAFVFEIIEHVANNTSQEKLLMLEQKYLNESKPWQSQIGFNMCKFVGSPGGQIKRTCSAETRKLMSEQRKGKPKSDSFKQTLSALYKGKSMKERTENLNWVSSKVGKTMKEITNNPNWVDSKVGKKRPEEFIKKLSESRKGEGNPCYGKRWKKSEELIAKQTGENNHMFGKTGSSHHGFNPETITLVNKNGETASKTRFEWRSQKVDINALLSKIQISSKGWSLQS